MKMDFRLGLNTYSLILVAIVLTLIACGQNNKKERKVVTKDMLLDMNRQLIHAESDLIQKYLEDQGTSMDQSQSGLWYRILEDSIGHSPVKGQWIHLMYRIEMLDGTLCYSSDQNGIWSIEVGKGNIESGMQEAIQMLSIGDSAQFIMPPHLAHGLAGDGDRIPGRCILKYNIRVLEIDN